MHEDHSPDRGIRDWLARTAQASAGPFQQQFKDANHLEVDYNARNLRHASGLAVHKPNRRVDAPYRAVEDSTKHRKRKYNSSETSLLDIASARESIHGKKQRSPKAGPSTKLLKHSKAKDKISITFSSSDSTSSSSDGLDEQAFKRRPRRKTREEKYELKEAKNARSKQREKKTFHKKLKGQKRKERTGSTLLHNFKARNVAQDRLTLRPLANVGIFGKSRASLPCQRPGLPDLSFSELKFDGRNRDLSTELDRDQTRRKSKKDRKARDLNEEISRYFQSSKPKANPRTAKITLNQDDDSGYFIRNSTEEQQGTSADLSCSLPPIELPGRPFLGFGERGPGTECSQKASDRIARPSHTDSHVHSPPSVPQTQLSWSTSPVTPRTRIRRGKTAKLNIGLPAATRDPQDAPKGSSGTGSQEDKYIDTTYNRNSKPLSAEQDDRVEVEAQRMQQPRDVHGGRSRPTSVSSHQTRVSGMQRASALNHPPHDNPYLERTAVADKLKDKNAEPSDSINSGTDKPQRFQDELKKLLEKWKGDAHNHNDVLAKVLRELAPAASDTKETDRGCPGKDAGVLEKSLPPASRLFNAEVADLADDQRASSLLTVPSKDLLSRPATTNQSSTRRDVESRAADGPEIQAGPPVPSNALSTPQARPPTVNSPSYYVNLSGSGSSRPIYEGQIRTTESPNWVKPPSKMGHRWPISQRTESLGLRNPNISYFQSPGRQVKRMELSSPMTPGHTYPVQQLRFGAIPDNFTPRGLSFEEAPNGLAAHYKDADDKLTHTSPMNQAYSSPGQYSKGTSHSGAENVHPLAREHHWSPEPSEWQSADIRSVESNVHDGMGGEIHEALAGFWRPNVLY